jgi:hypothetical protein
MTSQTTIKVKSGPYKGKIVEMVGPRPKFSAFDYNVRILETGSVVAVRKNELF